MHLRRKRGRVRSFTLGLLALGAIGAIVASCGARSGLPIPLPDPPPPDCMTFEDCPGHRNLCEPVGCELEEKVRPEDGLHYLVGTCIDLEPPDCDDDDECTIDSCHREDGSCSHRPAMIDADGDGYFGPRAGFSAWDEHGCGDDCDDTSAAAHPGATEICDGVDNDCNRIIDDGATWLPLDAEPVRISNDGATPAAPGGIAWSGESWMSTFDVAGGGFLAMKSHLAPDGTEIDPHDDPLGVNNADTYSGPVVWVGDRYGTLWLDRTVDYQVYFALLDENGTKVSENVQVAYATGFSLEPGLAWTGQRFVAVWKQEFPPNSGVYRVEGQLLDIDGGKLLAAPVPLATAPVDSAQAPAVAASSLGVGLVYTVGNLVEKRVAFRSFDSDLEPDSEEVFITVGGSSDKRYPTIAANRGDYVLAWQDGNHGEGGIWGAVVGQDGTVKVEARQIVDAGPDGHTLYSSLRALGDRALLVYSADLEADDYELWARMFDASLNPLEQARRITFAPALTGYQRTAFGPDGTLGVLFRDDREGPQHVWFTRLGCAVAADP